MYSSSSAMKKKKKRSTAGYVNTYQLRHVQSHHDDVARVETDQFTRHGRPWCDFSELRLSLSLEPQLFSFDQRANVKVKKLSLAEDLLFLHWCSRRCSMCNRSTLHRTTSPDHRRMRARKRDGHGVSARGHFLFVCFCANPGKPMRAPDEKQRINQVHPKQHSPKLL